MNCVPSKKTTTKPNQKPKTKQKIPHHMESQWSCYTRALDKDVTEVCFYKKIVYY